MRRETLNYNIGQYSKNSRRLHITRSLAVILVSLLTSHVLPLIPAHAEEIPAGALAIEADDALEWNQNNQTYTAHGNAVAKRDDLTVKADTLIAHYQKGKSNKADDAGSGDITHVEARGNVTVMRGDTIAQGDEGDYDLGSKIMTLRGTDLKLTMPAQIVTARESLIYNEITGQATAKGDAAVVRGEKRLSADIITANFTKNSAESGQDLSTVDATGNVAVTTPTEIIRGMRGHYDAATEVSTIEGNVKITRGPNQLNGDKAEVNMKTGISKLLAAPGNTKPARVKALIFPKGSPAKKP